MADKKAKILKAYGVGDSKSKHKATSGSKKTQNNGPKLIDHKEGIVEQPIQENVHEQNHSSEENKVESQAPHLPDLEEEKQVQSTEDTNGQEHEIEENKNAPPQINTTNPEGKAVKDMTPIEYFWAHQKSAAENRAKEKKSATHKGRKGKSKKADLFKASSVPVSAPKSKQSPKNRMEESKGSKRPVESIMAEPDINKGKSKTNKK